MRMCSWQRPRHASARSSWRRLERAFELTAVERDGRQRRAPLSARRARLSTTPALSARRAALSATPALSARRAALSARRLTHPRSATWPLWRMVFKKKRKVRNAASQREADKKREADLKKARRLRDPPDRIRPRASDVRSSSTDRIGSDAGSMFNGSGSAYDDEEEALMTQTQAPSSHPRLQTTGCCCGDERGCLFFVISCARCSPPTLLFARHSRPGRGADDGG